MILYARRSIAARGTGLDPACLVVNRRHNVCRAIFTTGLGGGILSRKTGRRTADAAITQQVLLSTSVLARLPASHVVRALFVSYVNASPILMKLMFRLFRNDKVGHVLADLPPASWLVNYVYWHFCAGATHTEVQHTAQVLKAYGFQGSILGWAREASEQPQTVQKQAAALERDAQLEQWVQGNLQSINMSEEGSGMVALKFTGAGDHFQTYLREATENDRIGPPTEITLALDRLCSAAKARGVRILVDAEASWYQSAIHRLALQMMKKFNKNGADMAMAPLIYNTYQLYLKESPSIVERHIKAGLDGNFSIGFKLVRGAYLLTDERSLIWETKSKTDACYNKVMARLLEDDSLRGKFGLVIASHNTDTVKFAQEILSRKPNHSAVFAQLLGMNDVLSFSLVGSNLSSAQLPGDKSQKARVYKYLVWGPTKDCLLYLLRRADENQSRYLDKRRSQEERKLYWRELYNRVLSSV